MKNSIFMVYPINGLDDVDFQLGPRGIFQTSIESTEGNYGMPYGSDGVTLLEDSSRPKFGIEIAGQLVG